MVSLPASKAREDTIETAVAWMLRSIRIQTNLAIILHKNARSRANTATS
jgi:3-methyladenine DNA glycosylase AlkD